ncbi:MAG: hypothetical protein AAB049_04720, partial [Nitrospirota bacterium]
MTRGLRTAVKARHLSLVTCHIIIAVLLAWPAPSGAADPVPAPPPILEEEHRSRPAWVDRIGLGGFIR